MATTKIIAKIPEPSVAPDKAELTVVIEAKSAKQARKELEALVGAVNDLWAARRQERQG